MKNRCFLQYAVGIFFVILSLFVFPKNYPFPSTGAGIFVFQPVIFTFLIITGLGLLLHQFWAVLLGKYLYPPIASLILLYVSYILSALSLPGTWGKFILCFVIYFDFLFFIFIFPIVLYFYSAEIKRISSRLKVFLLSLCIAPIVYFIVAKVIYDIFYKKEIFY